MSVLQLILGMVPGFIIGMFNIGQVALIATYGLPMTLRLRRVGALTSDAPFRKLWNMAVAHSLIFGLLLWATSKWLLEDVAFGFLAGSLWACWKLFRSRHNEANVKDLMTHLSPYLAPPPVVEGHEVLP